VLVEALPVRSAGWLPQIGHRTSRRQVASSGAPDASNLRVWLDGDDIDGSNNSTLTNGNTFASWTNKGTLGGTMAQAVGANQPTFRTGVGPGGARPAADFDGVDDFMDSSLAASTFTFLHDGTGATIYTVAKTSLAGARTLLATGTGAAANRGIGHRYDTTFAANLYMSDGAVLRIYALSAINALTNGSFDMMASTLASADTPDASVYVNGTSVATGDAAAFSSAAPASTLRLGLNSAGIRPFLGPIYQAMVYAGSHDTATRAAVLAFLVAKAGVASYPVV